MFHLPLLSLSQIVLRRWAARILAKPLNACTSYGLSCSICVSPSVSTTGRPRRMSFRLIHQSSGATESASVPTLSETCLPTGLQGYHVQQATADARLLQSPSLLCLQTVRLASKGSTAKVKESHRPRCGEHFDRWPSLACTSDAAVPWPGIRRSREWFFPPLFQALLLASGPASSSTGRPRRARSAAVFRPGLGPARSPGPSALQAAQ